MTLTMIAAVVTVSVSAMTSTPRITGVAPQVITASPNAQVLMVGGEGLIRGLSLAVMSPSGSTQVYSNIEVASQEGASFRLPVQFPVPGAYLLTITNTDGGTSQPFRLDVRGPGPMVGVANKTAPVISTLTPSKAGKQTQPQTFNVEGQQFVQGLTVTLNDPTGDETIVSGNAINNVSSNSFTFTVILTVEGEYTVSVTNPGGSTSNSVSLSVRGLD